MDAAKKAVNKITGRTGHTTDVDEVVNPAITRETVKPHRHEEVTEAVDREVHQDHYHTTVQPVAHSEVLPEQHSHNILPTQKKEFVHGDHQGVKSKVAAELGQFTNTSTTHATKETSSMAPSVAGEHVHHHVHETVQPVIHKETIQPEVVHTTVPVHQVHHGEAQHHGMSALPTKTLDEFKQAGGILTGNQQHAHEEYAGAPRPYNSNLQTTADKVLSHVPGTGHHNTHTGVGQTTSTGLGTNTSTHTSTHTSHGTSGVGGHTKTDSGIGTGTGHETGTGKPSMMDKMNPKTDADRDGKAGIMD